MDDDLLTDMTRTPDHVTSTRAAETVNKRKPTLRQIVLDYAARLPLGFIDENLLLMRPDLPESSLRKRRTELTEENIILASTEARRNSKGQDCIVWRHRDHVLNPPPIKPREVKPSRFDELRGRNAKLEAALRSAIKVAEEARVEWDEAPSGMRAGKILIALSGALPGYRADIDAIHAALKP